MSTYPLWLKCLVAFGAPATAVFATTRDWAPAIAAGFGGLAGLGFNDVAKGSVEKE